MVVISIHKFGQVIKSVSFFNSFLKVRIIIVSNTLVY